MPNKESSSAKKRMPIVSSAAYNRVEMAVRPFTNTSNTELSRQTRMCKGSSSCPVPFLGSAVVKSVCGARSGAVFIGVLLFDDRKEGRSMVKVSAEGSKERVVAWAKSVVLVSIVRACRLGHMH